MAMTVTHMRQVAQNWFEECITRPGIFTEQVTITPEMAKQLLDASIGNRKINTSNLAKITSDS